MTNVRFERNHAERGAAIHHADGPLTTGCDFDDNVAGYPGAAVNKTGTGALSIAGSRFSANSTDGPGGAISFDGIEGVAIADREFASNSGSNGGGGLGERRERLRDSRTASSRTRSRAATAAR